MSGAIFALFVLPSIIIVVSFFVYRISDERETEKL
jgi:hypothetical protein